jgi:hypothetical protein
VLCIHKLLTTYANKQITTNAKETADTAIQWLRMDSRYRPYRTNQADKKADRVLLFRQVTIKKEKADPSHFLKFLLANRTNSTFGFARYTSQAFAKPKVPFFHGKMKTFPKFAN